MTYIVAHFEPGIRSIYKIHSTIPWTDYVDFWPKILLFRTPQSRNPIILLTLLHTTKKIFMKEQANFCYKPIKHIIKPEFLETLKQDVAFLSQEGKNEVV